MRLIVGSLVAVLGVAVVVAIAGFAYVRATGLRGLPKPGPIETAVARTVRGFAIPRDVKARVNPLAESADALAPGLEHFARYCTVCHGNDGKVAGTAFGNGLYPKPPDLRAAATQELTDGELFYIIENGVRFTGMPAFGTGEMTAAGEKQVWQLVSFIRHLTKLSTDEIEWMKTLNPL